MTTTIANLAMLAVQTPFEDFFGTVLDLCGAWTQELLDSHADGDVEYPIEKPKPLAIWEGDCDVATHDADTEDESKSYRFRGKWRPLTSTEWDALRLGYMPLSGRPFPRDDKLISIPK